MNTFTNNPEKKLEVQVFESGAKATENKRFTPKKIIGAAILAWTLFMNTGCVKALQDINQGFRVVSNIAYHVQDTTESVRDTYNEAVEFYNDVNTTPEHIETAKAEAQGDLAGAKTYKADAQAAQSTAEANLEATRLQSDLKTTAIKQNRDPQKENITKEAYMHQVYLNTLKDM